MVGILGHGGNHFIVRGPLTDRKIAFALVRYGLSFRSERPPHPFSMDGTSCHFRKNLEWSVSVLGDGEMSPAVTMSLKELLACGVTLHGLQIAALTETGSGTGPCPTTCCGNRRTCQLFHKAMAQLYER